VLVLPGGGYVMHAEHEGRKVAQRFASAGFEAWVLHYRLASDGHHHPAQVHDAQRAVRLIQQRVANGNSRGRKIAVLGFSAGGHLAATLAVHHGHFTHGSDELARDHSARPDAAVLCYPVIDLLGEAAHTGSRWALLGEARENDRDLAALLSPQRHVSPDTPPTFLWHTAEDRGVPMTNSLLFAQACHAHGVPVELHVFENGDHGLGLAPDHPAVATWFDHAVAFLKRHLA
jgi:acetyl esterase/lipase